VFASQEFVLVVYAVVRRASSHDQETLEHQLCHAQVRIRSHVSQMTH
jgi:hypothetical protein